MDVNRRLTPHLIPQNKLAKFKQNHEKLTSWSINKTYKREWRTTLPDNSKPRITTESAIKRSRSVPIHGLLNRNSFRIAEYGVWWDGSSLVRILADVVRNPDSRLIFLPHRFSVCEASLDRRLTEEEGKTDSWNQLEDERMTMNWGIKEIRVNSFLGTTNYFFFLV